MQAAVLVLDLGAIKESLEPLAATAALAMHARLRLIPNLRNHNQNVLAWNIHGITGLAILFAANWD